MPKIVSTTLENITKVGCGCITNPKHEGFKLKKAWFEKRYEEGLRIKVLYENQKRIGFIEYVPAEKAWRPVIAPNYLFIQCLWTKAKKDRNKGYGGILIEDAINYARENKFSGVIVITSEGSWIAGKTIFLKHGFTQIESKDRYDLLVNNFEPNKNNTPHFKKTKQDLTTYQGLHLVYADQCPYISKGIKDLKKVAKDHGFDLKIQKIETPEEIISAPSIYGVFTLIYNGKIYADHYISKTRFRNILTKEIIS